MRRRLVHRAMTVLALTAALALAGAHPASAQELGFFERGLHWLIGLWSAPAAPADSMSMVQAADTTDKGLGVDPNGTGTSQVVVPPSDGAVQ